MQLPPNVFYVAHYAGPVGYDITDFLLKNKDALAPALQDLGSAASRGFVRELFFMGKEDEGSGRTKKKTLGFKFKEALNSLMDTLGATEPHFVRCVKPNAEKQGDIFTASMTLAQLRYSGLLEVCRIRQQGYPARREFKEFMQRYNPLCQGKADFKDVGALVDELVSLQVLPPKEDGLFQLGKNKVFMRMEIANDLEDARSDVLARQTGQIQKVARGFVSRRMYLKYKGLLEDLEAAVNEYDENLLERAILNAGALPYNGFHMPQLIMAKRTIETIYEEHRIIAMVEKAMETKEVVAIEGALASALKSGVSPKNEVIVEAQALIKRLELEVDTRSALRTAMTARNLDGLKAALEKAEALGEDFMDECMEVKESQALAKRLQAVKDKSAELQAAIAVKDLDLMDKIVTKMVELGAKGNPLVAQAEFMMQKQAEASAQHARRCAELKREMQDAARDGLYEEIMKLEVEAQSLGISNDPEVQEVIRMRLRIEYQKGEIAALQTAMDVLKVKSERHEGIDKADIKDLTTAIKASKASGLLSASNEHVKKAIDFEARMVKQISVQKDLEKALTAAKEGKDAEGVKLKKALEIAIGLGLRVGIAKEAQNKMKDFTEKKDNRIARASIMGGQGSISTFTMGLGAISEGDTESTKTSEGSNLGLVAKTRRKSSIFLSGAAAALRNRNLNAILELKIPTEEEMEAWKQTRIKSANNTKFTKRVAEATSDTFEWTKFIRIREDNDFTELEPIIKKKGRARKKTKHQNGTISKSLLQLGGSHNDLAIRVFQSIQGWCGDIKGQFPPSLAVFVLRTGLDNAEVMPDEIYCQLLKQLTENKRKESEDKAWLLMCLVTQTFPPSAQFELYLLNFFSQCRTAPGMVGNYARWCIYQVGASVKMGPSRFVPQIKEINDFMATPPILARVYQIFRTVDERLTWAEIPVWPNHNVAWLTKQIAAETRIPEKIAKYCGIFVKDHKYKKEEDGEEKAFAGLMSTSDHTLAATFHKTAKVGAKKLKKSARKAIKGMSGAVGRQASAPNAPWPVPGSANLGNVYQRMIKNNRVPVFTYQRQLFLNPKDTKEKPDRALYVQLVNDVIHNRLPILNEAEVIELAAIAIARGCLFKKKPYPTDAKALLAAGLFNYIPVAWCLDKAESHWTKALLSFVEIAGSKIPKLKEDALFERYTRICQRSLLYGASLFSTARRDVDHNYTAFVNFNGVSLVHQTSAQDNDIIGTVPFSSMEKFGASATFVWLSVATSAVEGMPKLFPPKNGVAHDGILYLYSPQAVELYQTVYAYSYLAANGKIMMEDESNLDLDAEDDEEDSNSD